MCQAAALSARLATISCPPLSLPAPLARPAWAPPPPPRLRLREWLAAPWQLTGALRERHEVHLLYLPAPVVGRVQAAAAARSPGSRISTNDALQGLLHSLVAAARGKPLVPAAGQVNALMVGECLRWCTGDAA